MKKTVEYMPIGTNPKELTLFPPVVGDVVTFSEERGYSHPMSDFYADRLVADNPRIFKIVPFVLPDPFTSEDLAEIEDLNELEAIASKRFGENIDKREGVTKARMFLLDAQTRFGVANEWPYEITTEFLNGKKAEEIKAHFPEIDFTGLRKKSDLIEKVINTLSETGSAEE